MALPSMPYPWNIWSKTTDEIELRCLANALSSLIETQTGKSENPDTVRPPNVSGTRQRTFYWRGFVSPVGTSRPTNHNKAYLQSHSSHGCRNPANPQQKAGGKWPREQKEKSFRYPAPYRGGPRGAKKWKKKTWKINKWETRKWETLKRETRTDPTECTLSRNLRVGLLVFFHFSSFLSDNLLVTAWIKVRSDESCIFFYFPKIHSPFKHRLYTCNSICWYVPAFNSLLVRYMQPVRYMLRFDIWIFFFSLY